MDKKLAVFVLLVLICFLVYRNNNGSETFQSDTCTDIVPPSMKAILGEGTCSESNWPPSQICNFINVLHPGNKWGYCMKTCGKCPTSAPTRFGPDHINPISGPGAHPARKIGPAPVPGVKWRDKQNNSCTDTNRSLWGKTCMELGNKLSRNRGIYQWHRNQSWGRRMWLNSFKMCNPNNTDRNAQIVQKHCPATCAWNNGSLCP